MASSKKLVELNLECCGINADGMRALAGNTRLKLIGFSWIEMTEENEKIIEEINPIKRYNCAKGVGADVSFPSLLKLSLFALHHADNLETIDVLKEYQNIPEFESFTHNKSNVRIY